MLNDSERLMTRATLWFLHYKDLRDDIAKTVEHFAPGVRAIAAGLDKFLSSEEIAALTHEAQRLSQKSVPERLARSLVSFDPLFSALDIVETAIATNRGVEDVAGVYFQVGERLNLSWLRAQIGGLPADSHWEALARMAL